MWLGKWLIRRRQGPGQERYHLSKLLQKAMTIDALTIDPRGQWSPVQARKVLEIINPQAWRQGLLFRAVDITTFDMPHRRLVLFASCIDHDEPVGYNEVCRVCKRFCDA